MGKPMVAIIGRQNVGKSTLLNRLAGQRIAIVADLPGTTRDRVMADVSSCGRDFAVVDTGGLELESEGEIDEGVRRQAEVALAEADAIIFLVDVRGSVTPADQDIADMLRRSEKPLVVAANKADNPRLAEDAVEFHSLGLGEPFPISAHHGRGVAEMMEQVVALLPPPQPSLPEFEGMRVAVVGRPNVGKSTLLNTMLGEERVITSDVPGTTRDSIDTVIDSGEQSVLLIDTSGIKRRGRIGGGVSKYSVLRALKAIDRADVVLLVLDSTELATAQDIHIAGYVESAGKGIVLVVNKWDLVEDKDTFGCTEYVRGRFRFIPYASVLYASAKSGKGVNKIMPRVSQVYEERGKRLATAALNSVVQQAVAAHPPPRKGRRQLKVLYVTQADVAPPTFVFFVNDARLMHFSYQRYLENKLRGVFGFAGTPLKMTFKSRGEK